MEDDEEELSLFFFPHNKTPSLFFQQQQQQNTISSLLRIRRKAYWTQFRHKYSWIKLSPVYTMARAQKIFLAHSPWSHLCAEGLPMPFLVGKDIVFRFIIEYGSLGDFGS
jgi:hypothetical protein